MSICFIISEYIDWWPSLCLSQAKKGKSRDSADVMVTTGHKNTHNEQAARKISSLWEEGEHIVLRWQLTRILIQLVKKSRYSLH